MPLSGYCYYETQSLGLNTKTERARNRRIRKGRKMSEEAKSVLTPTTMATVIIISVILSFIGVLASPFGPTWNFSMVLGSFTTPIVILFIIMMLAKVASGLNRSLSPQKLALIYAATSMAVVFCYSMIPYGIVHNAVNARQNQYDWHRGTTAIKDSWVFGPIVQSPDEMVPVLEGGAATPWSAWSPFLGWWITYTIFWLLFWVGWMALLEERWVEVEKLPFPAALTGTLQIALITAGKEKAEGDSRLKYFLLGFIIGAVIIIPIIARSLNPSIPDIYGWTAAPYLPWFLGTLSVGQVPGASVIPVIAFLPVNPMIYALFYLFPAKILFSIWFFSLVGVLIPSQIAYYMGYYTALAETGDRFHTFMQGEPFKWIDVWLGAFIGLILTWFVLNLSYLKTTFGKGEPGKGAIAGRMGWAMILGSTVVILGLMIVAGANPLGALIIVFTMWVIYLSAIRIYGFASIAGTAWAFPNDWTHFTFLLKYLYMPDPGYRNAEITTTYYLGNRWTGELMGENNTQFGMAFAIPLAYKVGYDTGTNPRDITKVIIISGSLSAIIGYPVAIWYSYTVGTNNWPMGQFDAWWHWVFDQPSGLIDDMTTTEPQWPYLLAGILLMVVLSILNFRFLWWPLDPAGVALSLGAAGTGWLLPALVGWVLKTLVLRVGGTKLNDNVALPIAVGLIVGYWLLMFLGAILGMIQFFMPG
jgi:hypothetical protein